MDFWRSLIFIMGSERNPHPLPPLLFKAIHFSEWNGTLLVILVWTPARIFLLFGAIPCCSILVCSVLVWMGPYIWPFSLRNNPALLQFLGNSFWCNNFLHIIYKNSSPHHLRVRATKLKIIVKYQHLLHSTSTREQFNKDKFTFMSPTIFYFALFVIGPNRLTQPGRERWERSGVFSLLWDVGQKINLK